MAIFNASLMLQKRPIVAIHGTPEMGRAQIIVEFLHNLSIQVCWKLLAENIQDYCFL
jgi:hypothetical protein